MRASAEFTLHSGPGRPILWVAVYAETSTLEVPMADSPLPALLYRLNQMKGNEITVGESVR